MSQLIYTSIAVTSFNQNCTLLSSRVNQATIIIDPGGDADKINAIIADQQLRPEKILLTHAHLDHVGAAKQLAGTWNIPIIGPHRDDRLLLDALPIQSERFGLDYCAPFLPDQWLEEGQKVTLGEIELDVLHCPGHAPGHVVFYIAQEKLLICGDVLFKGSVGRTDLPGGDAHQLLASIRNKILPLGDDIAFIPGHGPGSTIGEERLHNPFLN